MDGYGATCFSKHRGRLLRERLREGASEQSMYVCSWIDTDKERERCVWGDKEKEREGERERDRKGGR